MSYLAPFIGYALAPLFCACLLWCFRPMVRLLHAWLRDGLLKRILFFSWKV